MAWLKRSLLVLAVFTACWIGAVWYWRATTRMPDAGDLAMAMLAMPMVLLGGLWLATRSGSQPATAGATAASTSAGSESPAAAQAVPPPAAARQLELLGAALRMPHGDSAAELAAAFEEGEARLDLDPELSDVQGFPMLAGRIGQVDTAPLADWLAQQDTDAQPLPPQQLRAITIAGDVASQLAGLAAVLEPDGILHLAPLLPEHWPQRTRESATAWLRRCSIEAGMPQQRLALQEAAPAGPLSALHGVDATTLLLACDSAIDPDYVERLAVQGKLYGSRNPNGRMPGEGAAGILLRPARKGSDAVRLLALHASPAGDADTTLADLAGQALAGGGAGQPAYLAADTDHRASSMSELMHCVHTHLPGLDTGSALACVGSACGHTGLAGTLAALALARHHAEERSGHALCLSHGEAGQRFALLVGPAPAPAANAPSLT